MKFDFLLTTKMYPIQNGGSEVFFDTFYFDNPRTKEEIDYVAMQLHDINYKNARPFPDREGIVSDECVTLKTIIDTFYKNYKDDDLVSQFYNKYGKQKNYYRIMARCWVIVRCINKFDSREDEKTFTLKLQDDGRFLLNNNVCLTNSESNYHKLQQLFAFCSFLLNDGNVLYNLLIDPDKYNRNFNFIFIELLVMSINNLKKEYDDIKCAPFCYEFLQYKNLFTEIGDKFYSQKFQYIAESLKNLQSVIHGNEKLYFLAIVGLIEMLLTHAPDANRYNIEESINKQFVNKLKLIIYENDHTCDLNELEKELRLAYKTRSDIAHGNFNELEKDYIKLCNFYKIQIGGTGIDYKEPADGLSNLSQNMSSYLQIVLKLYLKDENRLDLIKRL